MLSQKSRGNSSESVSIFGGVTALADLVVVAFGVLVLAGLPLFLVAGLSATGIMTGAASLAASTGTSNLVRMFLARLFRDAVLLRTRLCPLFSVEKDAPLLFPVAERNLP